LPCCLACHVALLAMVTKNKTYFGSEKKQLIWPVGTKRNLFLGT
jgi:hypothetical protein